MQKWEYVQLMPYGAYPYSPRIIYVWPSGLINLEWLRKRFGAGVKRDNANRLDIIDGLFTKAPHVWAALLQYMGHQGWEAVACCKAGESYHIFFKRPVMESKAEAEQAKSEAKAT
jgi:hypothetical protein